MGNKIRTIGGFYGHEIGEIFYVALGNRSSDSVIFVFFLVAA